jgi:hypothetical protein
MNYWRFSQEIYNRLSLKLDILEEHEVEPVEIKKHNINKKDLNLASRREGVRLPKQLPDYRPIGRGRGDNREAETGHLLA